jgi:hypothetical protein
MMGSQNEPGIVQRAIERLFQLTKENPSELVYHIYCSFVELHLDQLVDLLDPNHRKNFIILFFDCFFLKNYN